MVGANGYVGALLVNYLRAAGHHVEVAPYRLPYVPKQSIDADIVIHLAASGGGSRHHLRKGWDDPKLMHQINVEGMKALMLGIKDQATKVIFLSSGAVYGKYPQIPIVDEDSALRPASDYGSQKVEAEAVLRENAFSWMILRPCSIFGPSVNGRIGNSFHNVLVDSALRNRSVTMFGGQQQNDALYLVDLIGVILRACADEWHHDMVFNVSGEIRHVEHVLNTLINTLHDIGLDCDLKKVDDIDRPNVLLDHTRLQNAFPTWKSTPLEYAFRELITDYLQRTNRSG